MARENTREMTAPSSFLLDVGLPANVDAEKTILGAILLDNHALSEAEERLVIDDFSLDSHRRIYQRMQELGNEGHAVDLVTLANELSKYKEVEAVGGVAYLASLTEGLPRRPVIEEYIRIVKDKSLLRQLMLICSAAIARAADQSETALEVLNSAESGLLQVGEKGISKGLASLEEIVAGSFGSIDNLYSQAREVTGLRTHFTEFDKQTSGLQKSDLVIIAARPSMGKTAWAINIAQNAAIREHAVVAVFSLEMSKEALLRRMLAAEAMVDQRKLQTGFLGREDQGKLNNALERLIESKVFIDDTPGISLAEMRAKTRRLKQTNKGQLDLVLVDYLQLMTASMPSQGGKKFESRTQEVSAISRGLKALAKEMEVPVIALSQLSRASEKRGDDKRPMLSDLRESGSIEQDADVVAFIHRESYYNRDKEEDPDKNKAEIIIAKQRNGPTGTVELAFLSNFTLFANLDTTHGEG